MNLNEYLKGKDEKTFKGASGLPEGKTIIDLEKATIEEIKGLDGQDKWRISQDNKEFVVPKTVMEGLKKAQKDGKVKAEVVRVGLTMNDTKYTVLGF